MKPLYKSGLPFGTKLGEAIEQQAQRVKNNFASLIILDGGVGQGKTTLAVHIAEQLNGGPISFEKQLAMGGEAFVGKLRECKDEKLPVLIYDEGGDFSGRGAITRFNRMINRTFETYRGFKVIVIMALPFFAVLDQEIFHKGLVRFLVNCYNRSANYGDYRVYDAGKALYLKERMKKLTIKQQAYGHEPPNFRGHFLDLSPERSKELDNFSTSGKRAEAVKAETSLEGLLSYEDLSRRLQRSVIWVRSKVSALKIKERKVIDRRKYFDSEAIEKLEGVLGGT